MRRALAAATVLYLAVASTLGVQEPIDIAKEMREEPISVEEAIALLNKEVTSEPDNTILMFGARWCAVCPGAMRGLYDDGVSVNHENLETRADIAALYKAAENAGFKLPPGKPGFPVFFNLTSHGPEMADSYDARTHQMSFPDGYGTVDQLLD